MKTTIYDVAEKAGVSISTVSKVINHQSVGIKSKQKVLSAMEELNYKPSVLASALTGKRTSTIGFLLPDIANPLIAEMARRVEDRAHEYGFNVVICSTDLNTEKEARYVSLLRQKRVDGFILAAGFKNKEVVQELINDNVPVILLSDSQPYSSLTTVTVDNFLGGYELASHFIELGHSRIAVIAEDNSSSRERIRGYKQALQDSGLDVPDDLIALSESTAESAQCVSASLLHSPNPPTAIICCNDVLAIAALLGARENHVSVPDELSISGFDNTLLSKSSDPPLTTVEVPVQQMCSQAVDLLIEEIEGKAVEKQKILVLPKLIIRKSTTYHR
ncbi:LacI family DNA-binding transcriptional regulator [Bacillus halotolerans]|uniref:LacI family DNA-binding transcriptional regulator n=1 Tax=Bacillus halotolerans TaxID=260554 RepID=UPI002282ED5D|nr:LacI family DNA-binding transcriptional regulator [Bacillus halotolerans]MCY8981222.1 LacI family transcriptional regulator [Bacillus halotolerans]MEC1665299.1 LacI family DNA-binding transcriptional regulator [Bacillus halotolerans]